MYCVDHSDIVTAIQHETFLTANLRSSVENHCFVIKHLRLLVMDLRIMLVVVVIRHGIFMEVYENPRKFSATKVLFTWYCAIMGDFTNPVTYI